MKTVRFAKLVEKAGPPRSYSLWLPPKKDRGFQQALKNNRVMTVHHEPAGHTKDYGEVGYTKDPHGLLFVFPKSVKRFAGKRVVGIKYDLLAGE